MNFGSDFLNAEGSVTLAQGWSKSKDPDHGGFISKMFSVGPRIGLTNTNTDIHISIKAGTEAQLGYAVAKKLADKNGYSGPATSFLKGIDANTLVSNTGADAKLVDELVNALSSHTSVALPAGIEASNGTNVGATATAALLINEVAGNVGKSVLFGAHSNVEFASSAKEVLEAVQKAKGGTLFVDGVDLGYLFGDKSGMKSALAGVKNLIVFANETNDGVTDNALVLPVGTSLEKWGDSEALIGLHSISQAAMKPVNGNVIMSAEDILLQVASNKGLKAAVAVAPASDEPVDELIEEAQEAQTLPEDVEAGEEPAQPVVTAAPAPGLDAGNFFGYLKSWWEATVYPKYKTDGGSAPFRQFWTDTLKSGFFQANVASISPTWAITAFAGPSEAKFEGSGEFDLVLFPHPYTGMGRHSNRPWAREIPDPITNFSWGTWG